LRGEAESEIGGKREEIRAKRQEGGGSGRDKRKRIELVAPDVGC
jgi:hypothetical protein